MKKVIFIAASLLAIAACNKPAINVQNEVGYLSFNLAADDIIVTTKAAVEDVDSYTVYVGEKSYNYGEAVKGKVLEIEPGSYGVYAENMTPEAAHEGNGTLRLASEVNNITVAAGQTTEATLACKAVNAKITVTFEDSFEAAFSSWQVVLGYNGDDSRNLTIDEKTQNTEYFYNIHSEEKGLKLILTAHPTVNPGNPRTNNTTLDIKAGHHYTVNYSAGTSGYVDITVTADDSLTDVDPTTVTVNPYQAE